MEYEFVKYRSEHCEAVGRLLKHLHSPDVHCNYQYVKWKYEQNPVIPRPLICLATLNGEVVGMRGMFGTLWHGRHLTEPIVLPHADDLVIHPDHRSRGLFLPIMEALLAEASSRGYEYAISIGGGYVTQELSKATGWTNVGEVDLYRKPSTRSVFYTRFPLLGGLRRTAKNWLQRFTTRDRTAVDNTIMDRSAGDAAGSYPRRLPEENDIRAVIGTLTRNSCLHWDPNIDTADLTVLTNPQNKQVISSWRTQEYLRWRLGNPDRKYRLLRWNGSAGFGAMIVSWSSTNQYDIKIAAHRSSDVRVFEEMLRTVTSVGSLDVEIVANAADEDRVRCATQLGFDKVTEPSKRRRILITSTTFGNRARDRQNDGNLLSREIKDWHVDRLDTMGA